MSIRFRQSFRCAAGHTAEAPIAHKLRSCPVCVHGKPCTATLKPTGPGSRALAKASA